MTFERKPGSALLKDMAMPMPPELRDVLVGGADPRSDGQVAF